MDAASTAISRLDKEDTDQKHSGSNPEATHKNSRCACEPIPLPFQYTDPSFNSPTGIASAGDTMWIINAGNNTVVRIAFSPFPDNLCLHCAGQIQLANAPVAVGNNPYAIAYDGTNLWVTNSGDNTVSRVGRAGSFPVGPDPRGIAFDGSNIWVANHGDTSVTKLRASDGTLLGTFMVGPNPLWVVFDGSNIWVTNNGSNTVTKLNPADGTVVGTYTVGTAPAGAAFDGSNIWVANSGSGTLTKLRAADGTVLATIRINLFSAPFAVAFDSIHIWTTAPNLHVFYVLR